MQRMFLIIKRNLEIDRRLKYFLTEIKRHNFSLIQLYRTIINCTNCI